MPRTIITANHIVIKDDGTMRIEFKPDEIGVPSKSGGNNFVVATTEGFIPVDELRVSINVIKRK